MHQGDQRQQKPSHPVRKQAKDLNQCFSRNKGQSDNRNTEKHSALPISRERQSEPLRCHLAPCSKDATGEDMSFYTTKASQRSMASATPPPSSSAGSRTREVSVHKVKWVIPVPCTVLLRTARCGPTRVHPQTKERRRRGLSLCGTLLNHERNSCYTWMTVR
jgi:hypothetical protein